MKREKDVNEQVLFFLVALYLVFFAYIKRKHPAINKVRGMFLFCCKWVLTLRNAIAENPYFYSLNFILMVGLVFIHTFLVTSPAFIEWSSVLFLHFIGLKELLIEKK
ncbi:hypothetical protein CWS01_09820 [Niallia nealsonii]|uniref:Uncharacterized protein n=1 Tax=Niallia nealsonii TaxID=115979 RepID=A0A2N0Z2R0_9BACI|nr:hypothetical protein CWS01_09820 [Niallia nealsonii]